MRHCSRSSWQAQRAVTRPRMILGTRIYVVGMLILASSVDPCSLINYLRPILFSHLTSSNPRPRVHSLWSTPSRCASRRRGRWRARNVCLGPLVTLGDALERTGRTDSAYAVYETFIQSSERSPNCRMAPDAIWRAAVLRRLGELALARADTTNAVRYYNEFVELWKDADPELQPQVEGRARKNCAVGGRGAAVVDSPGYRPGSAWVLNHPNRVRPS